MQVKKCPACGYAVPAIALQEPAPKTDADKIREELRRIRGLLEIIVQEVAKESYTHF